MENALGDASTLDNLNVRVKTESRDSAKLSREMCSNTTDGRTAPTDKSSSCMLMYKEQITKELFYELLKHRE